MIDSIPKKSFILVYIRKVEEYKTQVLTPLEHLKKGIYTYFADQMVLNCTISIATKY